MARKRVATYLPNGDYLEHLTHPEAFKLVNGHHAEWLIKYQAIKYFDKQIRPRGVSPTKFNDVWIKRKSAGIDVMQVRSGSLNGIIDI